MIPENELGVIVLFASQAERLGFEIIKIQALFPDATIKHGECVYKAEFEYKASGFDVHGHDPRECDIIICWENDCTDTILPILELSKADWGNTSLELPTAAARSAYYWKRRALSAERQIGLLKARLDVFDHIDRESNSPKKDRILQLRHEYPNLAQSKIAEAVEASPSYVSETLREHSGE